MITASRTHKNCILQKFDDPEATLSAQLAERRKTIEELATFELKGTKSY